MKPVSPEADRAQTPDQQPTPEGLANGRFITLFQRIIDERAKVADSDDGSQIKMAVLSRIPGWEPDKTKFVDIENLINRIFVSKTSGFGDKFDSQDVTTSDFDPSDHDRYYTKRFKIAGDAVSVEVDHMRANPSDDEPRCISGEVLEQAPVELLDTVTGELEQILA